MKHHPKSGAESHGTDAFRPAHLGRRSRGPVEQVDRIPWKNGDIVVELVCDEFTSLCPVTEQPDFGTITVRYAPDSWLIESKSLKLYLWRFREMGVFNEPLVAVIADDLLRQIAPKWIEVEGHFHSRGGIAIHVRARREATDNEDIPF
jgi:7-cyano-7-deazaguanine reductase